MNNMFPAQWYNLAANLWNRVPADPFYQPRQPLWQPLEMREAPPLPAGIKVGPIAKRHALLIQPFYPKDPHASYGKHVLTPSLALTSLAAATPEHWRVDWWDENLLHGPPPMEPLPEVVGITVHLTFAERACQLAAWYRQHGVKVIMGGLHAIACPEELLPHADAIVIGDGVRAWPQVLADVERGKLRRSYRCEFDGDYTQEPVPQRQLISPYAFLTRASLMATRGCHNRCDFCFLSTGSLRMPCRERAPSDIARQFAESGEPYAAFLDNNLGANRAYLRQLCRELKPLGKIWSAAVSLDVTDDHALVREMSLAGCTGVFVGFESLSDENLMGARKRTPRVADYARRIQVFHDQGIQVNGSFVLGFDGDHKDVFQTTAQWIEQNRLECATFHILTPYPGTPLFRQMDAAGRLRHRDWNLYDTAHAVFNPKHMTPEELELGYDWLYRRLFSPASIWCRRPRQSSAVAPYLAMSLLYKRSNRLWHFLIKNDLVHTVWAPLVGWSRRRHLAFRRRLESQPLRVPMAKVAPIPISAGV